MAFEFEYVNETKQQNRKIVLFMNNAPCHTSDIQLSNIKLQLFPPNTTSKLQPLDQGIIHIFEIYYRKYVVEYIIARCVTVSTPYNIKITLLDVIDWIDASWQAVSEVAVRNTFRLVGFPNETHNHLSAVMLDCSTLSPTEDNNYYGNIVVCDADEQIDDENNGDNNFASVDASQKITEVIEMMHKLRLLATVQQPQLHKLISELESKLTDLYIDSKNERPTTIEEFFY